MDFLAPINATLNATSTLLIIAAFVAIKSRNITWHKRFMLSAVACSAIFLVGYLTRVITSGTHKFPEVGTVKTIYLVILFSHMVLAVVVLPMILRSVYLGLKRDDAKHKRIAKIAWPVWLYVSLTGVVVYVMLYHVAPRLVA